MEKKLAEFRKRKQIQLDNAPTQFTTISVKSEKPYFFVAWFKKLITLLVENRIVLYLCSKLSKIPFVGHPLVLKVLLWLILYGLFLELQFGIVYVVLSVFVLIYLNTSTKKRSKNTLSAYSVFNKDCERLDGTFTAEQFEKELTHRR